MIGVRMKSSRSLRVLATFAVIAGAFVVACTRDALMTAPKTVPDGIALAANASAATVVISQVYGGGGNAGSDFKNDFIEIHNRSNAAVDLTGWSVQYTSAAGTSFTVTPLTGSTISIAPGQYMLIQEAAGTTVGGGSKPLPSPSFTGTTNMSGTDGKVALVMGTGAVTCGGTPVACAAPDGSTLVDLVGYGAATFFEGSAATPKLSNANSASRNSEGCTDTNDNAADFTVAAASPRSVLTTPETCDVQQAGELDHVTVTPASPTIAVGATQAFTAAAFDAANHSLPETFTWSLNPTASTVASVDRATGVATALSVGDVEVIATTGDKADTATLHVVPASALPPTRFTEIHYDNVGTDTAEAIEIEGPAGTDLTGWDIVLYNGNGGIPYDTVPLSVVIPATCGARGVVVTDFPPPGIQNGSPDGFALVHGSTLVEFLSYEGTFAATVGPAAGTTSVDIGKSEESVPKGQSLQRNPDGTWNGPTANTFGACNVQQDGGGGGTGGESISFSGRIPTDPALPVGFEDQLFATLHGAQPSPDTVFTWTSTTPDIATIDSRGVMHALSAGTATFVATAPDGTTGTFSLPMTVATFAGTADYRGNAEFGIPTDADASDDFIITRDQYTISYSHVRNTPNWVSYEFDASHFGTNVDRCDCFTHDPALPASYTHLTTADYTGAGAFLGQGIGMDRGHMARSFDFTSGPLDNAQSYYFSNIVPQFSDLNQGPWAVLENYLGDRAQKDGKEVYIVDGPAGDKGTIKNEGKIVIPAVTWKVALVLPLNHGLADIHDYRDIDEVVAVIMPNQTGVRNVDWTTYKTTVKEVEATSGYSLFTLLPPKVRHAVETGTKPPVAMLDGPYQTAEGSRISLSGDKSFDGGGTIVDYSWSFGDGATATGQAVTHTYAQDGNYNVRLIVTDNLGVADTSFSTAAVANVAPSIASFAGASLLPGETYSTTASFTDPGTDPWSATADYGDRSAPMSLLLSGQNFTLSHTYMMPGTFTVTVSVSDDDVTSSRTQFVTVMSQTDALNQVSGLIGELADDAGLNSGNSNSLRAKLDAARQQLGAGDTTGAANQLQAMLNEISAIIRSGRVSPRSADALVAMVNRVIKSISL
jgi:DNA/RNA endonuclease G (NUC1)